MFWPFFNEIYILLSNLQNKCILKCTLILTPLTKYNSGPQADIKSKAYEKPLRKVGLSLPSKLTKSCVMLTNAIVKF